MKIGSGIHSIIYQSYYGQNLFQMPVQSVGSRIFWVKECCSSIHWGGKTDKMMVTALRWKPQLFPMFLNDAGMGKEQCFNCDAVTAILPA